jgi:hypothetical protein
MNSIEVFLHRLLKNPGKLECCFRAPLSLREEIYLADFKFRFQLQLDQALEDAMMEDCEEILAEEADRHRIMELTQIVEALHQLLSTKGQWKECLLN